MTNHWPEKSLVIIRFRHAARRRIAEEEDEQDSADETADVRHVGDAASASSSPQRPEAVEKLQQPPEPDHDQRRNLDDAPPQDHADALVRKQYQICAEHSGDRSRRSQA